MNEKALRILEYPKIIDMLTGYASSPMGKELCRNLMPSSDISEILQGQMETSDALTRVMKKGSLSFSGIRDIRGSLLRLKVGSTVGMAELLNIAATLDVALRANPTDAVKPMMKIRIRWRAFLHRLNHCRI